MKITILNSNADHPVNTWLIKWIEKYQSNHQISLVRSRRELGGGDILFLISCSELISKQDREKFNKTLVIHASDLPKGRGWSPHIWEIIHGANEITLSLLEAVDEVDSGDIWKKIKINIPKTALYNKINAFIFDAELVLMDYAVANFNKICRSDDELILIDQHAAHERVLFEKLKRASSASNKMAQQLLLPETIELGYRESEILNRLIPDLEGFGLEIEPFGGNSFVVKSLPALLENREIKPLVVEIVEKIAEVGFSAGFEKVIDQCLMLMACRGAIRANQKLTDKQIKSLLEQLDECENPSNCPHGRPTWIKWPIKSLEKSFNRIV